MADKKFLVGMTPYKNEEGEYVPPRYQKGVELVGGELFIISRTTPLEQVDAIVEKLDGMLFPGGVDLEPARYGAEREPECGRADAALDALELKLLAACMKRKLPIIGICRGCQTINVGLGGTLVQDIPKRYGTVHQMKKDAPSPFEHEVRIVPGTIMHELMGGDIPVDSYHHQCVERLADCLVPSAYAPEGFIEAFELPKEGDQFLMAVQWHPEVTLDDDVYSIRIFERFRDAIIEYMNR